MSVTPIRRRPLARHAGPEPEGCPCGGSGYAIHANREPYLSEHYREFEAPCPRECTPDPRPSWLDVARMNA